MKKYGLIVLCVLAVLTLSSCTQDKTDEAATSQTTEATTAEFVANAPETGAYNASTVDTETITVKGVLYRNRFQGNLILKDPQYETTPVVESSVGRFFRITGTEYDLLYNVNSELIGAPESLYCRDDQWQELNAYYSNPKNFTYSCIVEQKGAERKTYKLDEIDVDKLNELTDFCEANSYDPFASGNANNTRAVSSSVLNEPKYLFGITSNDGLFSFGAGRFFVIDNKLALEHYTVMSEEKTLIVDVPDELGQYFVSLIKEK